MGIDTSFDELQRVVHGQNVDCSDGLLALLQLHHGVPVVEANPDPLPVVAPPAEPEIIEEISPPALPSEPLLPANVTNTIEQIKRVVCQHFGVSKKQIESDKRTGKIVLARHVGLFLARKNSNYSFPEIGRRFGKRDHTTVLHAVRKMERMIAADPAFASRIDKINQAIDR